MVSWSDLFFLLEIDGKIVMCRTGRREMLRAMHYSSFYFIMKWHFPLRQPVDILLYSSTLRQVWNKLSLHVCLDYRMENNMKMSTFSSTESPFCGGTHSARFAPDSCLQHVAYQRGTVQVCVQAPIKVRYGSLWHALDHIGKVVHCGTLPDPVSSISTGTFCFRCIKAPLWHWTVWVWQVLRERLNAPQEFTV